jgi:hypothetical protein
MAMQLKTLPLRRVIVLLDESDYRFNQKVLSGGNKN